MTRIEYAAIFVGIIVGLGLANILASVHKLMEAKRRVRWDWLAPAMAVNATLFTLGTFWNMWVQYQTTPPSARYFIAWLTVAAALFLLYLACAATLPDEVPEHGVDLRVYYFENRTRIWGLFCATFVLYLATWAVGLAQTGFIGVLRLNAAVILMNVIGLALSIVSLRVRTVWWQAIAVITLAALFLAVYGPMLQT